MKILLHLKADSTWLPDALQTAEQMMRGEWALMVECGDRASFLLANRHNSSAKHFHICETSETRQPMKWETEFHRITIERAGDFDKLDLAGQPTAELVKYAEPKLNQYYPHRVTEGLPIVLFGTAGNYNSLNVVMTNLAQALHDLGINVRLRHYEDGQPEDRALWLRSRHLIFDEPSRHYAAITVDRCDPSVDQSQIKFSAVIDSNDSFLTHCPNVLDKWNSHDTVFTYSQHSQKVMREKGCRDVSLMPLGVDRDVFKPVEVDHDYTFHAESKTLFQNFKGNTTGNRFVFMVAGMIQHRKGLPETLAAYRAAFAGRDDVLLWVHGRSTAWGINLSSLMKANDPPMIWTDGPVNDAELNRMLNRADCYVSSHRLEGFGLLPLQAMAAGTCCIVSDYAGPKDYANRANAYMVPVRESEADEAGIPSGVTWGKADIAALIKAMRRAQGDSAARARKIAAGKVTAAAWGWQRAALAVVERIEASGHKVSRRMPSNSTRVDILIPVRNAKRDIERMLVSLFEVDSGSIFKVTICDDASTDGTWELLREWQARRWPTLNLLRNEYQIGCPASRNKLFAATEGEFCFVADCDLEFTQPGWLAELVRAHCAAGAGFTAPMLTYTDGTIQSAGGERSGDGLPCQHRFHGQPSDLPAANVDEEVLYAPGAALLLRRALLDTIGGMWEDYRPTYFDDVDWQMLARQHGLTTHYCPAVKIIHHDGSYKRQAATNEVHDAFIRNRDKFQTMWGHDL